MKDEYPYVDYETTIRCDVCDRDFVCKRSDIATRFGVNSHGGSYCSPECRVKLMEAIRSAYFNEH